ncbi:hypothetical protein [Prevotella nigrescens]|nr:hypothetical protein [Prevotella nigrescens]
MRRSPPANSSYNGPNLNCLSLRVTLLFSAEVAETSSAGGYLTFLA